MILHDNELARREGAVVTVRPGPMRLRWQLDDLVSSDGHRLRCMLTCGAKALDKPVERQMLQEVFLSRDFAVRGSDVVLHFLPGFRTAATNALREQSAQTWLENRQPLADSLKKAGQRIAFTCGIELTAPFEIELESPTVEQQRLEERRRSAMEARMAGQLEQVSKATDLMRQFEALRKEAPTLTPGELLKQVSGADQAGMLEALFMGTSRTLSTTSATVVAGENLLKVDLSSLDENPQALLKGVRISPLPDDIGPLRSLSQANGQAGRVLLVGARSGVIVYDESAAHGYRDANGDSQMGFNSAVLFDDQLWAAHREAGLVAWNLDNPHAPVIAIRPADLPGKAMRGSSSANQSIILSGTSSSGFTVLPGARNVCRLDSTRLLFASGNILCTVETGGVVVPHDAIAKTQIVAILPMPDQVVVVYEDGLVALHDRTTLAVNSQSRPGGRVASAALLPWQGSARLLLASDNGPVLCVGLDDPVVTQFVSPYRGVKVIVAAEDLIGAISVDRQRLLLWRPWSPAKPAAEVPLFSAARHRLADLILV